MQPTILYLDGADRRGAAESHDGQRLFYVLEGDVRVDYGDEPILLSAGDSIYLDATIPHTVCVTGKGKARVLSVAHEPHGIGSRRNGVARRKPARKTS